MIDLRFTATQWSRQLGRRLSSLLFLALAGLGVAHAQADSQSYAFNLQPPFGQSEGYRFIRHQTDDMTQLELIRAFPFNSQLRLPFALAWNQSMTVLYGIRSIDYDLVSINLETGDMIEMAQLSGLPGGELPVGLAIDHNNQCFILGARASGSGLYRCDLLTGQVDRIGSEMTSSSLSGLAADCEGNLYSVDRDRSVVYRIDPDTVELTEVSSLPATTTFQQGLNFDRDTGALFAYLYYDGNALAPNAYLEVDLVSGQAMVRSVADPAGAWVGASRTSCQSRPVSTGFSGAWFNPQTPGQGILLDALPQTDQLFVAWFTHETAEGAVTDDAVIGSANHRWLTAQGVLGDDLDLTLDLFLTDQGQFDQPSAVGTTRVGELTIAFENCEQGLVTYQLDDSSLSGSFPIERLAGDGVALCEALLR